ncbi:hypothetical protein [Streptomyces sp. NPDC052496]|uniref:hypothetical protein n=1 Tax=Streptomyces sp. NPDC052496 TaxID=3154951 RepID=UPI00343348E6
MAALEATRFPLMWQDGQSERAALYALRDVSAGDTVDLSQQFTVVKRCALVGTTVAAALAGSVSGTVVTIPAGAARDAAFLLSFGCAGPA